MIITGFVAAVVAGVVGLVIAIPAQASCGWGFGMAYSSAVTASCTSYNVIPVKVDEPQGMCAGYVTGRLYDDRAGTVRKPAQGTDTVYNVGSPTIGYLIFNPPDGAQANDIFCVSLTLSSSPALTPVVGSFEFSYNYSKGEIVHTAGPAGNKINTGYVDNLVILAQGKDTLGNPEVEAWCLDPQGYASTVGLTLSKATLAGLPAYPAASTLIDQNNNCTVPVTAYVLTSGEYQMTIGPNPQGVVNQIIFSSLTPTNVHFKQFNVNQQQ